VTLQTDSAVIYGDVTAGTNVQPYEEGIGETGPQEQCVTSICSVNTQGRREDICVVSSLAWPYIFTGEIVNTLFSKLANSMDPTTCRLQVTSRGKANLSHTIASRCNCFIPISFNPDFNVFYVNFLFNFTFICISIALKFTMSHAALMFLL